jgi:hypothetical protein
MTHPSARHGEAGSAYIIALLVLVVLSLLGLSLALVSQTEMQIGANDLTIHRTFYGSEGGFNMAMSRMLTVNSSVAGASIDKIETLKYLVPETRLTLNTTDPNNPVVITDTTQASHFGERIEVSPFMPLRAVPCDLCPAAEGDVQLQSVSHAVVATAGRVVWTGGTPASYDTLPRTAQKQIYLMAAVQPWWQPRWDSIADQVAGSKVLQETMGAQ